MTAVLLRDVLPLGPGLADVVEREGVRVVKHGRSHGSLEPHATAGLDYRVLDGTGVRRVLPDLWAAASSVVLLGALRSAFALDLVPDEDERAFVNVNVLTGSGSRYELHSDDTVVTLLAFANGGLGGALEVYVAEGRPPLVVPPAPGLAVAFLGSTPHAVQPLIGDWRRVTVPVSYHLRGAARERPPGLNADLFGVP